jgi:hypothetical protein
VFFGGGDVTTRTTTTTITKATLQVVQRLTYSDRTESLNALLLGTKRKVLVLRQVSPKTVIRWRDETIMLLVTLVRELDAD